MRKLIFILALCWIVILLGSLTACDPITSKKVIGPSYEKEGSVYCSHPGYCYMCMGIKMTGGIGGCGFALHYNCPGEQKALIRYTPMEITRKSGATERYWDNETVKTYGSCE